MTKNLGPVVSGYLDPTGRAFETTVFQAGKPVLDRELNLNADLDTGAAQLALRTVMPSGWLSDDFLGTSSPTSGIFTKILVPNTIEIPALVAHVNGWIIHVQHTNTPGLVNRLGLGAAPTGAGVKRTDIVILEVWRRLIAPVPDQTGKSPAGRIWRNGNVKIGSPDDLTLNYPDDLLDTNVGAETTKRVQIQYRLRVIQNVNLFGKPYGIDDPTVFANSVPTSPAQPNGTATSFTYVNQSAAGDPGLWVAGDGVPTNSLGTVDGYMYAIPLLGVFRRNQTAFSRVTNQNGGVASPVPPTDPSTSDRPDGFYHDMIEAVDLVDLRSGVSPVGWSLEELLEKNTSAILDNALRTEIADTTPYGGGCHGTTVFMANEFGGPANGGVAPESGAQQFDAVRRRFSDRAIYEAVTLRLGPPGANWAANDQVTINPAGLPVYPYAPFNWSSLAPAGVLFLDILEAHWAGPNASHKTAKAEPFIKSVVGLGTLPVTNVQITFEATLTSLALTNESLYVTLLVAYPRGVGLTHTPTETYGDAGFALNTPALPAGAPVSFASFGPRAVDGSHREVQLEYETVSLTYTQGSGTTPSTAIVLPERAATVTSVTTTPVASATLSSSGRVITLSTAPNAGSLISVAYTAQRPMPQFSNPQVAVYFRVAAPQMARNALLTGSLAVIPKLVAGKLISITAGSGSQDEGYPFSTAYVQTGGVFPSLIGTYSGESDLAGRAEISVADFSATTGLLKLPTYISMVANPEQLIFTRGLGDIDVEGRSFFSTIPPSTYIPNAYAQDLSYPDRHKNVLPILAELAADSQLGHRGQLVVILLVRYAAFDETNGVFFDPDPSVNTTTASVFRVKGYLLNKRV